MLTAILIAFAIVWFASGICLLAMEPHLLFGQHRDTLLSRQVVRGIPARRTRYFLFQEMHGHTYMVFYREDAQWNAAWKCLDLMIRRVQESEVNQLCKGK